MLRIATAPAGNASAVDNDADTSASSSGILRLKSVRDSQVEDFDVDSQSIQIDFGKYGSMSMDESLCSPSRAVNRSNGAEVREDLQSTDKPEARQINAFSATKSEASVTRLLAPASIVPAPAPALIDSGTPSTRAHTRTSPRRSPRKPSVTEHLPESSTSPNKHASMQRIVAPPTFSRYQRPTRPRSDSLDSMIDDAVPRSGEEFLRQKERAEYEQRLEAQGKGEEVAQRKDSAGSSRAPKPKSPSKASSKPSSKRRENSDTSKKLASKGKGKQVEGIAPRYTSAGSVPLTRSTNQSAPNLQPSTCQTLLPLSLNHTPRLVNH